MLPVGKYKIRQRGNPEGILQLQIIKTLRMHGHYCAKLKTKGSYYKGKFIFDPYQAVGCPDLIVFSPSLAFIEVKAPEGQQSPEQVHFQALCDKAGIPYILARSLSDIEKLVR